MDEDFDVVRARLISEPRAQGWGVCLTFGCSLVGHMFCGCLRSGLYTSVCVSSRSCAFDFRAKGPRAGSVFDFLVCVFGEHVYGCLRSGLYTSVRV